MGLLTKRMCLSVLALLACSAPAFAQQPPTGRLTLPVFIIPTPYVSGTGVANGSVTVPATSCYLFSASGQICAASDGVFKLLNAAGTDFTRLQFGGTTSSFPSLKRNATGIDVRLADDSTAGNFSAAQIVASTHINVGAAGVLVNGKTLVSGTAPTISSGFGTSPTIAINNGTAAFTINVGTGGVATTGVIGLPAATTGWNCWVRDLTAQAAHTADRTTVQTASTTTTASIENQIVSTGATAGAPWAASDILRVSCFAY